MERIDLPSAYLNLSLHLHHCTFLMPWPFCKAQHTAMHGILDDYKINSIVSYDLKKPGVSSMSFRYTSFSQPRHMVVPCPELIGFEAFNFCGSNALFLLVRLCIRLRLRSYTCVPIVPSILMRTRAQTYEHTHTHSAWFIHVVRAALWWI